MKTQRLDPVIYQTMTGKIQCVLVDGVLYIREWDARVQDNPNKWIPAAIKHQSPEGIRKRISPRTSEKNLFRYNCMIHAIEQRDVRSSGYRVIPESERIENEIKDLKASLRIARNREKAKFTQGFGYKK